MQTILKINTGESKMKLKIGDKVRLPTTKYGRRITDIDGDNYSSIVSAAIRKKQDYLYFTGMSRQGYYVLDDSLSRIMEGDYFIKEDIVLYKLSLKEILETIK